MNEPPRTPRPCFFTVTQLLMAWTALREDQISLRELRVYFALAEMKSRRCGGERGAVRKLVSVGLLRGVSKTAVEFATDPSELHFVPETLDAALAQLSRYRRLVPVPRKIVRLIASGARRTLIATILGHLICCPKHGVSDHPEDYVKASWIGRVFGVSVRAVKEQRQHLIALGWLLPRPTSQRTLNLHGGCFAINLGWTGAVLADESLSPPPVQEQSPAPASLLG